MTRFLNTTTEYHLTDLDSLGWELTVCNALYPENSPCRRILHIGESYGNILYDFLSGIIPMDRITRMIEIGGGYGYLASDFLGKNPSLSAAMMDISPFLLERQRETLKGLKADFVPGDFFQQDTAFFGNFDLAVLNEIVGDFPTLCEIESGALNSLPDTTNPDLGRIQEIFTSYNLEKPAAERFNFNIGAAEAVEKLCRTGVPYIFLSEHSCEASAPDEFKNLVNIIPSRNPERIRLRGHDEYTIRFSYLEEIARSLGYASRRGCYAEFLKFSLSGEIRFILASGSSAKDDHEIIRQFIEDLFKYEYVILSRQEEKSPEHF